MPKPFAEARKRQLARLDGAKPPTAGAAIALAKSHAYQDAADAPATLRAYASDLANCQRASEKCLYGCDAVEHEACGDVDQRLGRLHLELVILAEAAIATEPGEA